MGRCTAVTTYTCALCGRRTKPFAFIGCEPVGPTCAKRAGFTPAKARKTGARVRFVKPGKREAGPFTPDMFNDDPNP